MKSFFDFKIPSREEIEDCLKSSKNPELLTDRDIWILREFGGEF